MDSEKRPIEHSGLSDCYPPVGTRVVVVDGSEAHGDEGVVWGIGNGICLIELDAGCIWPIGEPWEVKVLCG
jgi:hypothetical protein